MYWEKQRGNLCRLHSLNAFFGEKRISDEKFKEYCEKYDEIIPGLNTENMDGFAKGEGILSETSSKEMQILANLEKDYQTQLSAYSTNYKLFMDSYYKAVKDVRSCKAKCLTSIPSDTSAYSYKRQACKVGCDLKGPYVQECKNTFKKSRIGSQTWTGATKGRCSGGNVVLGMDSTVTSINYADSNNVKNNKKNNDKK